MVSAMNAVTQTNNNTLSISIPSIRIKSIRREAAPSKYSGQYWQVIISNLKMSETPLAERKVQNNPSILLTNYHAYSPHPPTLPKQDNIQHLSQADSIEKILSTSIQRAKQKINMLEGKQREEKGENRHERVGSKEGHSNTQNNAIAAAMKVLQSRVCELQCNIENQERERAILLKQLDNLTEQKKIILANLQQSNLKITTLQQSNRNYKTEIKEQIKKLQANQNTHLELEAKCKTLEMNLKHLEQDKQQLNAQFARREQEIANKSSSSQKHLATKMHETEDKERQVQEKEKKLNDREKRLIEFENSLRQRKDNKELQQRREINQLSAQNTQLRKELAQLQRKVSQEHSQLVDDKTRYEMDIDKIRQLQMEINMLRETTKNLQQKENNTVERNEDDIDLVEHENRNLRNQNEELIYQYKRAEQKVKREEKQTKIIRERARELEDMLSQIADKINKLTNCPKDLKYLTVKAAKLINSHIERINTLKTPTKSRSNSLNRSLSRSNSQRKTTQQSKITNSRHSKIKGESGSKSKRKEESASKAKRVVVSQSGAQNTEREVAELKKEYKRLVKILDETENEEIRNRLNEIAFTIQEKNEKATKLRQANRMK